MLEYEQWAVHGIAMIVCIATGHGHVHDLDTVYS
jgi:hypothetical protein